MTHPQPCRKGTNLSGINVRFAEPTLEKKQPSLLLCPFSRPPSTSVFKSSEGLSPIQPSTQRESRWRHAKLSLLFFLVFKKILERVPSDCLPFLSLTPTFVYLFSFLA